MGTSCRYSRFLAGLTAAALAILPATGAAKSLGQGVHVAHGFHGHHFRHRGRGFVPYGAWSYGVWPYDGIVADQADLPYPPMAQPVVVQRAIVVTQPPCQPSREEVVVPAEGGGERHVTITRCH